MKFETEKKELVTFVGLARAGKTTTLNRLRTGEFYPKPMRTLGLNIESFEYRNIQFSAFDLGGQTTFQMLWEDYLRISSAVVFVVDCSNPDDFEESKEALYSNVLPYIKQNSIMLILANKADISGVDPYVTLLKYLDLYDIQQKGRFKAINIFHTSAKTGINFYQAFDWLIETLTGEIIAPNINIHNVCIYQTESGILVGSSAFKGLKGEYDPSLLTSMFSAVNTFAQASLGAGVREILMKRSDKAEVTGNYKLVRIEDSDYSVILIVDESDSMRRSAEIGKDLLLWTRLQVPTSENIPLEYDMELIDEAEIKTYLEKKFPNDLAEPIKY
ncbi:MAG: ADP-ribosylation factor-like protein [Candidatus Hodarchaeales archaeon]